MLNIKEHFKQIEMDTIQQEPLLTELTPEAAATVEGGILFRVVLNSGTLNIRSTPRLGNNIIGSFGNGRIINATSILRGGFRRLTVSQARAATGRGDCVGGKPFPPESLVDKMKARGATRQAK